MLSRFHREHPAVEISLSEDNSDVMVEALREGRLDVAFIGLADVVPQGVEVRVVYEDPLVVAVSHEDPLESRGNISLEEVRDRDIISLPRGTGLHSRIDEACARAGFRPRITFEVSDPQVLASLVENALGVAILPSSIVGHRPAKLRSISITHPRPQGRVALAWRSEGPISPAARAFVGLAREVLLPDED